MKRCIERTDEGSDGGSVADRTLLNRFADHGDEAAFAELVSRHGGLVLGVCRRVLANPHDADDAFQATFLVLARDASKIRRRASLAGWLHAVARRTAMRANAKRHRRREETFQDDAMVSDDTLARVASRYEQQLLDEELDRLPQQYREPLVLRYMLGKSNKQVAEQLGLTRGVVEGRLKRGKDRLRMRLARRGVGLAVLSAAVGSTVATDAAAVESLIAATARSAVAFRDGVQPPTGDCSSDAIQLANQEIAMSLSTATTSTLTLSSLAAAVFVTGLTLVAAGTTGDQPAHAGSPKIEATAVTDAVDIPNVNIKGAAIPAVTARTEGSDAFAPRFATTSGTTSTPPADAEESSGFDETAAEPDVFDFKQYAPAETKIVEALKSPTTLEFIETPLRDVVDYLKDFHDLEIQIDKKSLEEEGMTPDELITKNLRGISLRSALRMILRDMDLAYMIRDEVLLITTRSEEESTLDTRVYSLNRLDGFEPEALVEVIRSTVGCTDWDVAGGPGSIKPLPGCLVIHQSQENHEEITDLLSQLARFQQHERKREEGPASAAFMSGVGVNSDAGLVQPK